MKSPTDIRIDQLREELRTVKAERDEANAKVNNIKKALVNFVDMIVEYLGKNHKVSRKLLEEVEELR